MSTVADLSDPTEFEDLLTEAASASLSVWEMDFVDDLRERFDQYGERMFLSERQLEWLEQIARR